MMVKPRRRTPRTSPAPRSAGSPRRSPAPMRYRRRPPHRPTRASRHPSTMATKRTASSSPARTAGEISARPPTSSPRTSPGDGATPSSARSASGSSRGAGSSGRPTCPSVRAASRPCPWATPIAGCAWDGATRFSPRKSAWRAKRVKRPSPRSSWASRCATPGTRPTRSR